MSDSSESEAEDLSRFKEAVDITFIKLINESQGKTVACRKTGASYSERHLEVSSHYNDIRVPKEMQKIIGDKVSAIIDELVEYVNVEIVNVKKNKIKAGVKLFTDSEGFLSSEQAKDTFTEAHNKMSKKIKRAQMRRSIDDYMSESDKIKAAVVTGDYLTSKEGTNYWKSRRKERLFKYRAVGKDKNILIAL